MPFCEYDRIDRRGIGYKVILKSMKKFCQVCTSDQLMLGAASLWKVAHEILS